MQRSILSLVMMLIVSATTVQADIGPRSLGPPPGTNPEPATPAESPPLADLAPIPSVPEAASPLPMVIAGVAATAGVVLLGMWISKKGRSGGSQDQ